MTWHFANSWVFAFAAVLPVVWIVRYYYHRQNHGINTSVPSRVAAAGSSFRTLTAWIPHVFLSIAFLAMLVALARPQEVIGNIQTTRDAIALELVVDRSGSMDEPVVFENKRTNRLEAVKIVVEEFVTGQGKGLKGREGDLLGLIAFGSYADTLMPLTQSHEALVDAIRRIELPKAEQERSTAIGDALMLAIARLKAAEDSMRIEMKEPDFTLKSKAVVLLTDGENRAGTYSPQEAAQLAKEWGIKVYIIGIRSPTSVGGLILGNARQADNDKRMSNVAGYTGGIYWGVDQIEDLENVYAQIDELEQSTIRTSESTSHRELYIPFAIAGFIGYSLYSFLGLTFYRSVL
ncbi:MAG: VWA domain-containing protein [Phycisphaerales bacterium]|nr:VWA domain-containing protein [Phycisphaerales bacterium]